MAENQSEMLAVLLNIPSKSNGRIPGAPPSRSIESINRSNEWLGAMRVLDRLGYDHTPRQRQLGVSSDCLVTPAMIINGICR